MSVQPDIYSDWPRMRLDPGPIPLYHQLEQNLRARIRSGEFAPGAALPTEEQVCAQYGVSRITVRRALDALISQGLIIKRRGVGSFVAEPKEGVRSVRLVGSLDEFLASAGQLETTLLSHAMVEAPPHAREALRLTPGDDAVRLELLSCFEGRPVAHVELFLPPWVGDTVTAAEIESGTPTIRLIERKLNVRIVRAEQLIEADSAGEMAAAHLDLGPQSPILRVTRVYYASDGRPIEAVFLRHHPERYRYAIDFQAGRPNG